jgi:hypothetical protein
MMKHPACLLVPLFMLADHFLTLAGALQKRRQYDEHFKMEHYELNPIWQQSIAQRKWFNPRHILLTIFVSVALALLAEFGDMPEFLIQGLLGGVLVLYGTILGRHLANLLMFGQVNRRPEEITGCVTMTHALILSLSLYQYVAVLVPLALLVAFVPSSFAVGGLGGVILLLAMHVRWIVKHRREGKSPAASVTEPAS